MPANEAIKVVRRLLDRCIEEADDEVRPFLESFLCFRYFAEFLSCFRILLNLFRFFLQGSRRQPRSLGDLAYEHYLKGILHDKQHQYIC